MVAKRPLSMEAPIEKSVVSQPGENSWTTSGYHDHQTARMAHWDAVALRTDTWSGWGRYYHQRTNEIYQLLIPQGQRVLEIGCGRGDLLAAVQPSFGVGVDTSAEMVSRAALRHPELCFLRSDAHRIGLLDHRFDFIVVSDLVNDLWDVQTVFQQIARLATPHTRIILNFYSRLWELPLTLAERLGLARPALGQNWLTVEDANNLLHLTGLEMIRQWDEIVWPLRTPLLDQLCNRYLAKLWPLKWMALTHLLVARPAPERDRLPQSPSVSVVIPARNEAGNIAELVARIPEMGRETELVFVEGHSKDDTYASIRQVIAEHPGRNWHLLRQTGHGKGDAVRMGFAHATGDIFMILDADMTVSPEDLPRFLEALCSGKGELINGVRLVYPMEDQAMQLWNLAGNKFFTLAFSWLLGQFVKDTLCGTKVLWRRDYERIAANRTYFGDLDPFGDFDLLLGASKLNLRILDLPVRYRKRTYGSTNIQRWKHGWILLRMVQLAARRLKFV